MKFRGYTFDGSGCDIYNVISGICDIYNEQAREKAFDEYLKTNLHTYALMTIPFTECMRKEIRTLKSGKLSPHIPFICCRGCFEDILSSAYSYTYAALDPYLDGEDPKWKKVDLKKAPQFEHTEALKDFLIDKAYSEFSTAYCSASEDFEAFTSYIETFRKLLTEAARLAKRIKADDTALELLEAVNLTYTKHSNALLDASLKPFADKVVAGDIYEKAGNGWRRLWAAVEFRKLKV